MDRLYDYLLKSNEWTLDNYCGKKAFSFKKSNGNWSKTVYISKYGKEYKVYAIEGLSNFITEIKKEFKTYKEVMNFMSI